MMAIAIISAQTIPVRCDHFLDTDSASDSSDSVFFTRTTKTSSAENPGCFRLGSTLSDSSTMTSTETATSVATEADFDVDNQQEKVVDDSNKVKADVADDSNQEKASDANDKDKADVADDSKKDKAGDATEKNKAVDAKDATDHQKSKAADDEEDQDWGHWNKKDWSWKQQSGWQSQEAQQLGKSAKQRLNRQMRELCRPVHVGSLSYVLPDRSKKACLTWRNAIEHCVKETGKPPAWSEYFLECRVCHKFHRNEHEWEQHYISKHSDNTLYQQCMRRLKQWDTKDCSQSEVEANVGLSYGVGEQLNLSNRQIESDILEATGISNLGNFIDRRLNPDNEDEKKDVKVHLGSQNKPKEPARAPETPLLNKLTEKTRSSMGKIKKSEQTTKKDTKKKEKAEVVHVDEDENEEEYEYYSSSDEPPSKKQKKGDSKAATSKETMDVHGWKKRAVELEKMMQKLTRENKSLRRRVSSLKEKKTKKSKNWKKAAKSLLEAGVDTSSSEGKE